MELRDLEKTDYFGYLFFIRYDGTKFDSFDENEGKISVKGEFKGILLENGIVYYKGIQQAGRTDKDVSANENILYINTKQVLELEKIKNKSKFIEIIKIEKTLPYSELPKLISKRYYIYRYPEDRIKNDLLEITKRCEKLSGEYDVSSFTSKKGKKLKEKIRKVKVCYKNKELHFEGTSFMPQQVRIMSGYILNNTKQPLEGMYLTLEKIILSEELKDMIIIEDSTLKEENVEKIERNKEYLFFYVKKSKKGEVIGKKGKNIKKLRTKYGKIIIKEI